MFENKHTVSMKSRRRFLHSQSFMTAGPGLGYDTLILRLIPGDLLSAYPHRQFHTLVGLHYQTPSLMHCVPCREAVCTLFMMVFGMTPARTRTHNLPCESQTCLPLSQPNTVMRKKHFLHENPTLDNIPFVDLCHDTFVSLQCHTDKVFLWMGLQL